MLYIFRLKQGFTSFWHLNTICFNLLRQLFGDNMLSCRDCTAYRFFAPNPPGRCRFLPQKPKELGWMAYHALTWNTFESKTKTTCNHILLFLITFCFHRFSFTLAMDPYIHEWQDRRGLGSYDTMFLRSCYHLFTSDFNMFISATSFCHIHRIWSISIWSNRLFAFFHNSILCVRLL